MGAIVIRTRYDQGTESAEVATSATRLAWFLVGKCVWGRITAEVLKERSGLTRGLPIKSCRLIITTSVDRGSNGTTRE
jgi:hypothetical protein